MVFKLAVTQWSKDVVGSISTASTKGEMMKKEYYLQLFLNEYAGNYNGGRLCSYITGVDTELGYHDKLQQDFMEKIFPDEEENPLLELVDWRLDTDFGYFTTATIINNSKTDELDILEIFLFSAPTDKEYSILVRRMKQVNNGDFAELTKNKSHEDLKILSCRIMEREITIKDSQLRDSHLIF